MDNNPLKNKQFTRNNGLNSWNNENWISIPS